MKESPELSFIKEAIRKAYAKYGDKYEVIEHKGSYDLVTNIDISIESFLVQEIQKRFPLDNIIGEENYQNGISNGRNWTIDPIDGTVNMANNIPIYGVQCSMIDNGLIQLGVIYFPTFDYLCYAERGKGAYGQYGRLKCSMNTNITDAVVTLGDFSHTNKQHYKLQHRVLKKMSAQVSKIRMFGAASYDFFLLANGCTNAHIMFSKNLWDIIPGLIIAQEAGAVITNLYGNPYSFDDDNIIIAANQSLSEQIVDILR